MARAFPFLVLLSFSYAPVDALSNQERCIRRCGAAFATMPTSPTKGAVQKDTQIVQEQIRSRTTEAPAIRRLLFPSEPEVQDTSYFRDFSGTGQPQTDIKLEMNSTSSNPSLLQGSPSQIHPPCKIDKVQDLMKQEGSVKQQKKDKRKSRKMLAFEDCVNATQAWTSSCTTILLALHARAQTRIEEFQNTRAVKALVEDLPRFARRVAPSTPTRLRTVESSTAPAPPDSSS